VRARALEGETIRGKGNTEGRGVILGNHKRNPATTRGGASMLFFREGMGRKKEVACSREENTLRTKSLCERLRFPLATY